MNEKEFVMAWLIAARAGSSLPIFSDLLLSQLVADAKKAYRETEQECDDEANS